MNVYNYTMHKEAMNLKANKKVYMGGFGERKEENVATILYII